MNSESAGSSNHEANSSLIPPYQNKFYQDKPRTKFNDQRFTINRTPSNRFGSADSFTRNQDSHHKRFANQRYYPHSYRDNNYAHYNTRGRDFINQEKNKYKNQRGENKKPDRKRNSRESSPVQGSEEYMKRKIQQTSALIMRQLLTPGEPMPVSDSIHRDENKKQPEESLRVSNKKTKKSKPTKKSAKSYNVREIHNKIMSHITNLNDGKKKNLINNTVHSCYDEAIENIQKKKQLEISRALRYMCAVESSVQLMQETSNIIDAIIPDLGIKIEELPRDVIEQLSRTLNCEFARNEKSGSMEGIEFGMGSDEGNGNSNIDNFVSGENDSQTDSINLKLEPPDIGNDDISSGPNFQQFDIPEENHLPETETETLVNIPAATVKAEPEDYSETPEDHGENQKDPNLPETEKEALVVNIPAGTIKVEPEGCSEKPEDHGEHQKDPDLPQTEMETLVDILAATVKVEPEDYSQKPEDHGDNQKGPSDKQAYPSTDVLKEENILIENVVSCGEAGIGSNDNDKAIDCVEPSQIDGIESKVDVNNQTDLDVLNNDKDIKQEEEEILHLNQIVDSDDAIIVIEDEKKQECNENVILEENSSNVNLASELLDKAETSEKIIQTNIFTKDNYLNHLLEHLESNLPQSLKERVDRMYWIDDCISKLTNYRKSLFECYQTLKIENKSENETNISNLLETPSEDKRVLKKRKRTEDLPKPETPKVTASIKDVGDEFVTPKRSKKKTDSLDVYDQNFVTPKRSIEVLDVDSDNISRVSEEENEVEVEVKGLAFQQNILEFRDVHEKMLVLKLVEDYLMAGSESGKIYFCSLEDGTYTQILEVTTSPITSLHISNIDNLMHMFVGSCDPYLRIYSYRRKTLAKSMFTDDEIQCMEEKWGFIFLGGRKGTLVRYSIKKQKFEFEEKILPNSILVLKATQEGTRRVLIVGTRMQAVMVRDAMSGLFMRDLDVTLSPTVYCLLLEQNLVYCGTTTNNILVISFHEGKIVHKYAASKFKGISCMKIMGNLLFSGCHDGNIYVYDTNKRAFIDAIKGPGGVILSMEVLENQVIVGTMSFQFKAIPIPVYILRRRQLK